MVTNNLIFALLAMLPVVLYSYLIFKLIPEKTVSSRRARKYFATGIISAPLTLLVYYMFPTLEIGPRFPTIMSYFIFIFLNVGLLEESMKLLTFGYVSSQRQSTRYDLPIATMFYCMMSSAGFALLENVNFLMQKGSDVLQIRAFTAIVMHMVYGVIIGYFIARARQIPIIEAEGPWSFKDLYKHFCYAKRICMALLGVVLGSLLHGAYDLICMLPDNVYWFPMLVIIVCMSLVIAYMMIRELAKVSLELRKSKSYNDWELK